MGIRDRLSRAEWDCIGTESDAELTRTLLSCALVCRTWRDRARLHLYANVQLSSINVAKFLSTLRKNRNFPLSTIKKMVVSCDRYPASVLFTTKLDNLRHLQLTTMNLSLEHPLSSRAVLARSVRTLVLRVLTGCTVSSLIRFLNSFQSVTVLELSFSSKELGHGQQILPPPHPKPNRSLRTLNLHIIPGTSVLVEWYVREGVFLANLKELHLNFQSFVKDGNHRAYFDSGRALLRHCANSLEVLALSIQYMPKIEEISDMRKF